MLNTVHLDVEAVQPGPAETVLTLGLLAELGEMTAAEIAADLALRPSAATAILLRLERAGRARRGPGGGWTT
jgi:DNA-binding MarR family transcriptional regulator